MKPAKILTWPVIVFLAGVCLSLTAMAQETWEKEGEGEIKDLEIELTKERQLSLPRANRYFEKVPPRPFEPIVPAITYNVTIIPFNAPNYLPAIRPLRIRQEELSRLYGNYLSGGVGNYTSFMLDGSVATKRDKKKMLGADLYWRGFGKGPVDEDNSAQSTTRFRLHGSTTTDAAILGAQVNYLGRRGYFYGYAPGTDVNRDVIKQVYDAFSANVSMENKKKGKMNYRFEGGFSRLQDSHVTSENELAFRFDGYYSLKEGRGITLTGDFIFINRKDSLFDQGRNLIRIQPAYIFSPSEKFMLTAGVNLAITNDTFADGSTGFRAFPHLQGTYELTKKVNAYAIVTGNVDKVNLHSLTAENFWLDANQPIVHTERGIQAEGGIQATAGSKFSTRLGVSVTGFKSPYFYSTVRKSYDPGGNSIGFQVDRFALLYDKTMRQVNPYAEATYDHADLLSITMRADYFDYKTDLLAEAYHRPTYRGDVRIRYNLFNKFSFQAGFVVQGGMRAVDPVTGLVLTLNTATDLNVKVRYFLSRQISAFVQLDNILSSEYPIYYNYPARGFQALVGASWSF